MPSSRDDGGGGGYHPQPSARCSTTFNIHVTLFLFVTGIKILLFPTYHSTDFDVHRNWLAITYNKPLSEWYWEDTSEWTLDYPPFFAYFEWCLAQFAAMVDPEILTISAEPICSKSILYFQRTTVVVTDTVLLIGVVMYCDTWPTRRSGLDVSRSAAKVFITSTIALFNPGLLMIDHIHFQYNGFLLGIFLISIAFVRRGQDLMAAATFASLLLFKHIFFYCAPLYFVYLLRHYCFVPDWSRVEFTGSPSSSLSAPTTPRSDDDEEEEEEEEDTAAAAAGGNGGGGSKNDEENEEEQGEAEERLVTARVFSLWRFIKLASVVIAVVAVGFGPFLLFRGDPALNRSPVDVMQQILSRLFPFGRGLVHAYWAPNVWALYYALDKALVMALRVAVKVVPGVVAAMPGFVAELVQAVTESSAASSATGGLVQVQVPDVLPTVPKQVPFLLTFLLMAPILAGVWTKPHPKVFPPAMIYCCMCSFMLGYHVHEKAILMVILPLSFVAAESAYDSKVFLLIASIGHFSLFPLLFGWAEFPIKVFLVGCHSLISYVLLDGFQKYRKHPSTQGELWEKRIQRDSMRGIFLGRVTKTYWCCLAAVFLFKNIFHPLYFVTTTLDETTDPPTVVREAKLEFLPLMLMSVVCAGGMLAYWYRLLIQHHRKLEALSQYTLPLKPRKRVMASPRSPRRAGIPFATDSE